MSAPSARELAVRLTQSVLEGDAFLQDELTKAMESGALTPADNRFLQRLSRGTVEHVMLLDWYIGQVSSVPVRKMKPRIRAILRVTAEQLFFMEVPDRAAVSEAVRLAKTMGLAGLSGFVNAVSRKLASQKSTLTPPKDRATRHSVPEWILKEYEACATADRLDAALAYVNDPDRHGITVHLHEDMLPADQIITRMEQDGLTVRLHDDIPGAADIEAPEGLGKCTSFAEGLFTVQDAGSIAACLAAGICPGDTVLDLCAAPGGKTVFAAHAAGPSGHVTARDLSRDKTDKITENLWRCRVPQVKTEVWDATTPDPRWVDQADVVIADLPCSGLGDIARKPDIRYRQTPESVKDLAELQRRILTNAITYVKPGGTLLYATCTVTEEENAGNVKWLLANFPEYHLEDLAVPGLTLPAGTSTLYGVQFLPGELGGDGFFFARFVRQQ